MSDAIREWLDARHEEMEQVVLRNGNAFRMRPVGLLLAQIAALVLLLSAYFACLRIIHTPLADETGIFFVDADCYSRMTRVLLLAGEEPWGDRADAPRGIIHHQTFENYPAGIRSHATFFLDGVLLAGGHLLGGKREDYEMAGRWVSPLAGALLLTGFWIWAVLVLRLGAATWPGLLVLAFSPILLHGFALDRPDHQSLAVLLCGLALLAESAARHLRALRKTGPIVPLAGGIFWGLAVWVTWLEPLVLWMTSLLFWTVVAWREKRWKGFFWPRAVTVILAGAVILLEGWPTSGVAPGYAEVFWRWSRQIGELQGVWPWVGLPTWAGWMALFLPLGLAWVGRWDKTRVAWWVAVLLALVTVLMGWHGRWGYFAALCAALGLSVGFSLLPPRSWIHLVAWSLFILGSFPMLQELERLLFPSEPRQQLLAQEQEQRREARRLANWMRNANDGSGSVLAPWWTTPSVVYWSGVPGVAGSSHQSLPGISYGARFWWSPDPQHWREILQERKVRWILVPPPEQSLTLAGSLHPEFIVPDPHNTAAYRLWHEREIPGLSDHLQLRQRGRFFRLWEVVENPGREQN